MNNHTSMWYLVYTKAKEELRAKKELSNQGFETFVPIICKSKVFNKLDASSEVMFPRYIFIKLDISDGSWQKINSTRGVSHLVIFGDSFAKIDTDIINYIISKCDYRGIFFQRYINKEYIEGDEVIIEKGPFKDYDAIFLSKRNQRVKILLKLANEKKVLTDLPIEDIPSKTTLKPIDLKKNQK